MLGPDLVRVRRRGDSLMLTPLRGTEREEALRIATDLVDVVKSSLGLSLEELGEALDAVERLAKHEKLFAGLKKLMLDQCEFETKLEIEAAEVRKAVFVLASSQRKVAESATAFSRDAVLGEVGRDLGIAPSDVEEALFSDLRGAALLSHIPVASPETLVERYDLAQIQGILLRASALTVTVECRSPEALRALFHKLKFRRLLFRLHDEKDGRYRIEVDGPFSLFESVTKYGLQLALVVPAFQGCKSAHLSAVVHWGKERRELSFETELDCSGGADGALEPRDEVKTVLDSLTRLGSRFAVNPAREILNVPGQGLCVPDLKFEAPGAPPVYLEVLGFWSRDAVFNRVEWAETQADLRVLFAVSSRLRVKKEVLPEESRSALYVYKGAMNARAIIAQVEELASRS